MKLTINSRKLGKPIIFSRPGESYIFVDFGGCAGTNGEQICKGGYFTGSTISYHGDSQEEFNAICRRWWKRFLENTRDHEDTFDNLLEPELPRVELFICAECGITGDKDEDLHDIGDGRDICGECFNKLVP